VNVPVGSIPKWLMIAGAAVVAVIAVIGWTIA